MTNTVLHISLNKIYHYKSIHFDWHNYLGPTFLRIKDGEMKNQQFRPCREYGLLSQWLRLSESEREVYRVY
jgi:hypothetical protein